MFSSDRDSGYRSTARTRTARAHHDFLCPRVDSDPEILQRQPVGGRTSAVPHSGGRKETIRERAKAVCLQAGQQNTKEGIGFER